MLLRLDRHHRITYILSVIFNISSRQWTQILDISPVAYRKRLSRARERIQTFMLKNCILVNEDNPCHCDYVAADAIQTNEIDPKNLFFKGHRCRTKDEVVSSEHLQVLDSLQRAAAIFRKQNDYTAPETFLESLKELIHSGQVRLFQ